MSEAVLEQPEGSAETPGPASEPEGGAASTPAHDPGDFQSKIMQGGEAAWEEFRKQQASASRANARLREAELAIQIAEKLGDGDLRAGGETALKELMQYRQMRQDPVLARMIERWQRGERIEGASDTGSGSYGYEPPADEDPRVKELQALRSDVATLKTHLGLNRTVEQIKAFMDGEIGAYLTPEEKREALLAIQATMKSWGETPLGREKLMNFSQDDAETIVLKHLARSKKLLDLGRRDAQQRSEQVRSRETDGPSRIPVHGASRSTATPRESPEDSVRIVAQQLGIRL